MLIAVTSFFAYFFKHQDTSISLFNNQSNNIFQESINKAQEKPTTKHINNTAKENNFRKDFFGELVIYAANIGEYTNHPKYQLDLYPKGKHSTSFPPLAIVSQTPMQSEYISTREKDTQESKGEYVFRNHMDIFFYGKENKKKSVRINISNSQYIYLNLISSDDNFTIAQLEMEGEGLSEDTYSWTSCLLVYHKNLNRVMDLTPFGCVFETPHRLSMQYTGTEITRSEISFDGLTTKNGINTLKFQSTPRLATGEMDNKSTKYFTYQFAINPKATADQQLKTIAFNAVNSQGEMDNTLKDYGFSFEAED